MLVGVVHASIPNLIEITLEIILLVAAALLNNGIEFIQFLCIVPRHGNQLLVSVKMIRIVISS